VVVLFTGYQFIVCVGVSEVNGPNDARIHTLPYRTVEGGLVYPLRMGGMLQVMEREWALLISQSGKERDPLGSRLEAVRAE
jgi:hypothetical protein